METLSPCFFYVCKLPKYLEKPLFWTDGKDCRHSNVDKLDKRCYNLVTIFAYIIEKTALRIFPKKFFSKPLDLE